MKTLILALVVASLPYSKPVVRPLSPVNPQPAAKKRIHGRWFMAHDGHAIYCYGPVVTMDDISGPKRYATYCRGESPLVELKD
ncbi:MAG TPA: hypothetical protein VE994_16605 [Terriglobales bacterium]|nr:hypothetical protein [Terriglobales bacterium]